MKQRRKSPESSLIDIAIVQGLDSGLTISEIALQLGLRITAVNEKIERIKTDMLIVQGMANDKSASAIGKEIGIKEMSVQARIHRLKARYGLKHTHSLVAYFYKLNWIK